MEAYGQKDFISWPQFIIVKEMKKSKKECCLKNLSNSQ